MQATRNRRLSHCMSRGGANLSAFSEALVLAVPHPAPDRSGLQGCLGESLTARGGSRRMHYLYISPSS